MITTLIIIAIIAAVAMVWWLSTKSSQSADDDLNENQDLSIQNIRVGDVIVFSGGDLHNASLTVESINRYEGSAGEWREAVGMCQGKRRHLEIIDDDELECWLQIEGDITLKALELDEQQLISFDEQQDRSNEIDYQAERFSFERSGEVFYWKNNVGEGEGYYQWEFASSDGRQSLAIEKWEGEPFSGCLSERIPSNQISIFRQ